MNNIGKLDSKMSNIISAQKYDGYIEELVDLITSVASVNRYNNIILLKPESVAEHTCLVGIIIAFLYDLVSEDGRSGVNLDKVLASSIFHDVDEIFTGDMLNPVKYFSTDIVNAVNEYSDKCLERYTEVTNNTSLSEYFSKKRLNENEKLLLKLADIISVYIKLRMENGLGNSNISSEYINIYEGLGHWIQRFVELNPNEDKLTEFLVAIRMGCYHRYNKKTSFTNILKKVHQ